MAAGDIIREFGMGRIKVKLKTTTGCTKGQLLYYDTDGYAPATQAIVNASLTADYKFLVALETVTAPASGQSEVHALAEGVVEILKVTGAIVQGQFVGATTTAGQVGALAKPDAPASYAEATAQAEFDKLQYAAGYAVAAAASGDATVKVRLVSRE